ncbi:MAG: YceI family protein [Bacteroidota bacterium]
MKNLTTKILAVAIIMMAITIGAKAQTTYKIVTDKDVTVKVLGTSNVHDWVMSAGKIESQGNFKVEGGALHSLSSFTFSIDAKSLKSEHESMDKRTYKTIKADDYPKIIYKLMSATITTIQKGKYLIKAKGDLTIAGATQSIVMDITAIVNADNTIICSGTESLKLTDYKINPPSFMLGAMKVKNDLTIQFNLIYKN